MGMELKFRQIIYHYIRPIFRKSQSASYFKVFPKFNYNFVLEGLMALAVNVMFLT